MAYIWKVARHPRDSLLVLGVIVLVGSGTLSLFVTYQNTISALNSVIASPLNTFDVVLLVMFGVALFGAGAIGVVRPAQAKVVGTGTLLGVVVYTAVSDFLLYPLPTPGYLYVAGGIIGAGLFIVWSVAETSTEEVST